MSNDVSFIVPIKVTVSIGEPRIMGKALPCQRCKTDRYLKWKTYSEDIWWIACEGCGNHSEPKSTMTEAGEQWNQENWKPASHEIVQARRQKLEPPSY